MARTRQTLRRGAKTTAIAKITKAAVKAASGSKGAPRSTSVKIVATPATVAGRKSSSKKAGVTSVSITSKPVSKAKSSSVKKATKRTYRVRPYTAHLSGHLKAISRAKRLHRKGRTALRAHRARPSHTAQHHVGRVADLRKKIGHIEKRIAFHERMAMKNTLAFNKARSPKTERKYRSAEKKHLAFVTRLVAQLGRRTKALMKHEGELGHYAFTGHGKKSSTIGHYISKKAQMARTRIAKVHRLEKLIGKALTSGLSVSKSKSKSKSKSYSRAHPRRSTRTSMRI